MSYDVSGEAGGGRGLGASTPRRGELAAPSPPVSVDIWCANCSVKTTVGVEDVRNAERAAVESGWQALLTTLQRCPDDVCTVYLSPQMVHAMYCPSCHWCSPHKHSNPEPSEPPRAT